MAKRVDAIPANVKTQRNLYFQAMDLYKSVTENFESIEQGNITYIDDKFKFEKVITDAKSLLKLIARINVDVMIPYTSSRNIEIIEKNILQIYEDIKYIENILSAEEYVHDLYIPLRKYLTDILNNPRDYRRWADNEETFIKKVIGALTDADFLNRYKGQIKRIILGTMSQKEFNKIFDNIKYKITEIRTTPDMYESLEKSFISYKDFKKNN